MKFLFALLLNVACLVCYGQNNSWLKGTWYGIRTFPSAESTIGIPVRLEIGAVRNNNFTARLVYMFPSDTSARLIIRMQGAIKGTSAQITKSNEIYLQHTLLREIWRECSGCAQNIFYGVNGNNVVMKIEHYNCSDSCNGESIFYKRLSEFDSITRVTLRKNYPAIDTLRVIRSDLAIKKTSLKNTGKPGKDSVVVTAKKTLERDSVVTEKLGNKDSVENVINKPLHKDSVVNVAKKNAGNESVSVIAKKPVAKDSSLQSKTVEPIIKSDTIAGKIELHSEKNKPVEIPDLLTENKPVAKTQQKLSDTNVVRDTIAKKQSVKKTYSDSLASIQHTMPDVKHDTIPLAITQRVTKLITTYQVSSPHINVQLFDNGEIDYDAVSVYYNGRLIINHQTLTHKAITFSLEASATNRHHEFILIADTEGMIPPNTALMRITAGSQHYELEVSSSTQRNAKIAIDYTGQ